MRAHVTPAIVKDDNDRPIALVISPLYEGTREYVLHMGIAEAIDLAKQIIRKTRSYIINGF